MIDGARIQQRLKLLGISQAELARRVNLRQSTINGLVKGEQRTSGHLHVIARELQTTPEYLTRETDDDAPDSRLPAIPAKAEDDDSIEIDALDLAYGMGGTFLDTDDSVSVEKLRFSRSWVRRFTKSAPEFLFVAEGIGDSMTPTIHDRDMVVVDRAERVPQMGDKVWAISFGGVGMIKRLRPMPDGTMKIMSDNPSVSEERATDGELFIIGRVVAILHGM